MHRILCAPYTHNNTQCLRRFKSEANQHRAGKSRSAELPVGVLSFVHNSGNIGALAKAREANRCKEAGIAPEDPGARGDAGSFR